MLVGNTDGTPSFAAERRITAHRKFLAPWVFSNPTSFDYVSWNNVHTMEVRHL